MRLCRLHRDALSHACRCPERSPLVPQRVERRLGADLIVQILDEYVAGAPTPVLARHYGIGNGTLLRLLREHGVGIRHHHRRS
jgi:hypothetical protein